MKKIVLLFAIVVLLGTSIYASFPRIAWTPAGFVVNEVSGMQVAGTGITVRIQNGLCSGMPNLLNVGDTVTFNTISVRLQRANRGPELEADKKVKITLNEQFGGQKVNQVVSELTVEKGQQKSFTFNAPGLYTLTCNRAPSGLVTEILVAVGNPPVAAAGQLCCPFARERSASNVNFLVEKVLGGPIQTANGGLKQGCEGALQELRGQKGSARGEGIRKASECFCSVFESVARDRRVNQGGGVTFLPVACPPPVRPEAGSCCEQSVSAFVLPGSVRRPDGTVCSGTPDCSCISEGQDPSRFLGIKPFVLPACSTPEQAVAAEGRARAEQRVQQAREQLAQRQQELARAQQSVAEAEQALQAAEQEFARA